MSKIEKAENKAANPQRNPPQNIKGKGKIRKIFRRIHDSMKNSGKGC